MQNMLEFLTFHNLLLKPSQGLTSFGGLFHDRLDFFPEHFHFARERRRGEFGFLAALGCFFICP